MSHFQQVHELLAERFPQAIVRVESTDKNPWIEVAVDQWPLVAKLLRDDSRLAFNFLNCITGIDYLETDPKKAKKLSWEPHVELVYHLTSLQHRDTVVIKIKLSRWREDEPGQLPQVPSVAQVWRTADWHEREVYDLMGIEFTNHPDLRRILCPEDWQGHPLRKDYEMPLEYHGIRGR